MKLRSSRLLLTAAMSLLAVPVMLGTPPASAGGVKVDICHIPPGNSDNFHTITVSENALNAHLAHGDVVIGGCNSATFLGIHQTGQTTSHAPGDDGFNQMGVIPPEPRFTDNDNGTITDNLTGFFWLKDARCMEDTTWEEAHETAITIGDGDCGLTDGSEPGSWRVANIKRTSVSG